MFKLYELTEMYQNIQELISNDETNSEELEKALREIKDNINSKVENIAKLIKNIEGDIEVLKIEENRLSERRRTLENKKDRIKNYLESQLKSMGISKVKTPLFTVSIQKNPPRIDIENEEIIPDSFVKYTKSILKKDIIQALKNGKEVPGVKLIQTSSLRIR